MSDPIPRFLARDDEVLHDGCLGLLCNHTAWSPATGAYLFESLDRRGTLRRIFAPEHGLFAELQDQIGLTETDVYGRLGLEAEIVSLYGENESSLTVDAAALVDLDALIVDIQDVGSRYYTFATTLAYVFDRLAEIGRSLHVFVIDRPNPSGRQVEGTLLPAEYGSFVGRPGLPHRHGLTIGELAELYRRQSGADVRLIVQEMRGDEVWNGVPPSPNMPWPTTALVYSGGCLLEGTNLSEGRGTTRPFELLGAPWLDWTVGETPPEAPGVALRKTRFVPTFHKHAGQVCFGFQLHLTGGPYHSLGHMLRLLRWIREGSGERFEWRTEAYEFRSDRPAIEILAGDPVLLDYLHGRGDRATLEAALCAGEERWIRQADGLRIYPEELHRCRR